MPHKPIAAGKSSFDLVDFAVFLSALDIDDNVILLGAACGSGRYALEIASQVRTVKKVYAFDLWEEGIARLKLEADSLEVANIEAAVCDLRKKFLSMIAPWMSAFWPRCSTTWFRMAPMGLP